MIVSAHQPHYLPWIGYVNKIFLSDVFMIMDNMTYTNKGYINRNRILTSRGVQYLTVPLLKPNGLTTKINELEIDVKAHSNWNCKHLKSIKHNYYNRPGYCDFFPQLEAILERRYDKYFDLQYDIIKLLLDYLSINTRIQLASEKNTQGQKETKLIEHILKDSNCDKMLLGMGASSKYVDINYVRKSGYDIVFQQFKYPVYKQNKDKYKNVLQRNGQYMKELCNQESSVFIPGISIVDLIFNNTRKDATILVKSCGSIKQI